MSSHHRNIGLAVVLAISEIGCYAHDGVSAGAASDALNERARDLEPHILPTVAPEAATPSPCVLVELPDGGACCATRAGAEVVANMCFAPGVDPREAG